jgi:hypothetical protein
MTSNRTSLHSHLLGALVAIAFGSLVACSNSESSTPPPADPSNTDTGTTREALEFIAPCTAAACGEVPASTKSTKPACTSSAGACEWSDTSPDGTVSYRACAESECGAKPDASVCPSGTTYKGSNCGSENEGPCVWRSACTPPPSTTPCPDADGCGPMPAIGVICKDGSNGSLACMKQGNKCGWERTCE